MKERPQQRRQETATLKTISTEANSIAGDLTAKARRKQREIDRKLFTPGYEGPLSHAYLETRVKSDIAENQRRGRMIGGLASKNLIRPEHVKADGSLDIAALKETGYFKDKTILLDALAGHQLTERSKLRKSAKKIAEEKAQSKKSRTAFAEVHRSRGGSLKFGETRTYPNNIHKQVKQIDEADEIKKTAGEMIAEGVVATGAGVILLI